LALKNELSKPIEQLVNGVAFSLILWGLGSLVHLATGASRKKAMA
jgi:hypothetical protein